MSGALIGLRTGSYGSLQQVHLPNGVSHNQSGLLRKPSKVALSSWREKERLISLLCRYLGRRKVAMLLLVVLALLVFVFGSFTVDKGLVLLPCVFKMTLVFSSGHCHLLKLGFKYSMQEFEWKLFTDAS
ncbi:hypothetical protein SAY87_005107 [Trapa incisa]|uniref:Uncharacterized protein n=1 Tax=Trapa incisa TaxID=236973 RepID=A0AAN7PU26_9MYRT|nr:hypothetical protein SAY87_005107 [Trapa incisa]